MKSKRKEYIFVEQELMIEAFNRSRDEIKGYAEGLMDAIYIASNWSVAEWAIRRLVILAQLDIDKFNNYWDSGRTSMVMIFIGTAYLALTGERVADFTPAHGKMLENLISPSQIPVIWILRYQYK